MMVTHDLAVVPIITNAGVAVLPAVIAGMGSVVALLFKPRQLLAVCRRKPHVPLVVLLVIGLLGVGTWWMMRPPTADVHGGVEQTDPKEINWNKVAMEFIRYEQLGTHAAGTQRGVPAAQGVFNRRGDFARTGYLGGESPRGLQPLWEFTAGEATYYFSDAAVHGERIFAAGWFQDVTGMFGIFSCVDRNGKKLWEVKRIEDTREPLKGFFSSPVVTADGKYVLIGQGLHLDPNCDLLCLEAATGKLKWRQRTKFNHIEGTPAIWGDIVVVGAGAIEQKDGSAPEEGKGLVLAVKISTGEKLWEFEVTDPESSPAIGEDGTVYIGAGVHGNMVLALRSETDADLKAKGLTRVLWQTRVEHPATGVVTLVGDRVLIGIGNGDFVNAAEKPAGAVVCLDRKTGQIMWQTPVGDGVLGAVAVRDDRAYTGVRHGEAVALQLNDGKVIWRQKVSASAALLASIAVTESTIYAVSSDGVLSVLERADGKILETVQVNSASSPGVEGLSVSSPIVVDGRVYVGSETGGLRCFVGGKVKP